MSDAIITVENLGKRYSLSHLRDQRYVALRDVLVEKATGLFRRNGRGRSVVGGQSSSGPATEDFWALKGVSFQVKQGEVVGIIGRNGAGKSTLLKILSRITDPTEGRVTIRGRVASLLEVGTGFHPELTGRENIYLNGAILGMHRQEIKARFEEIVAFAEIEKFLDTPVKRYSSGMYVRLAFAVAAHLEPEILIVDEILAVGDFEFQKKCLGKMKAVSVAGRTVLFVSHNLDAITSMCSRALLFGGGSILFDGSAEKVASEYVHRSRVSTQPKLRTILNPQVVLEELTLAPNPVPVWGELAISITLRATTRGVLNHLALLIFSQSGIRAGILDFRTEAWPLEMFADSTLILRAGLTDLALLEGDYSLGLFVGTGSHHGDMFDLAELTVTRAPSEKVDPRYASQYLGIVNFKHCILPVIRGS